MMKAQKSKFAPSANSRASPVESKAICSQLKSQNRNVKLKTDAPAGACPRCALCAVRCALQQSETCGFTLLEMIISVGIFSVLVVASIGVTLSVSNAELKAANIQSTQDNIRFGTELLAKELRTGSRYTLSNLCPGHNPGEEINFLTSGGDSRLYYASGGRIIRVKISGVPSAGDCGNGQSLMADEVAVEHFHFIVSGAAPGAQDGQPRATLSLGVRSKGLKDPLESVMNLQTTVVQRLREF